MPLERVRWTKGGRNSGPILHRLWTNVDEILGQRRAPLVLSNVLARLSVSCLIQKIFAIKSRGRR